jgi:hypothetical protein
MKKHLITLVAVVFFAALTVTAVQGQGMTMSVTIPFDFGVGGKTFPAGEYYLQRSSDGERVVTQIRSRDKTLSMYLPLTHPVQDLNVQPDSKSKLVFNKYGDQFFLSQVWVLERRIGEELPKIKGAPPTRHSQARRQAGKDHHRGQSELTKRWLLREV